MATTADFNAEALLAAKRAKALGLTQFEIASALKASQSQVSRVLSGNSRRRSKLLDSVCNYVFSVAQKSHPKPQTSSELMAALSEVWDGSVGHAQALARVIRSLGLLHPAAVRSQPAVTAKAAA